MRGLPDLSPRMPENAARRLRGGPERREIRVRV